MTKPESFILTTDFATLKNDDQGSISVTIPSGLIIGGGKEWRVTAEVSLGQKNAPMRSRVASTKEGNRFYVGSNASTLRNGFISGNQPVVYSAYANLTRVNSTTLRATAHIRNPYSENLITEYGDETFTFYVNTFLSPFEQNA